MLKPFPAIYRLYIQSLDLVEDTKITGLSIRFLHHHRENQRVLDLLQLYFYTIMTRKILVASLLEV